MTQTTFTVEQINHAKNTLLCEYLQEKVDNGEYNILQAIEEQIRINDIFARGKNDVENGDVIPASPMLINEIKRRASQLRK